MTREAIVQLLRKMRKTVVPRSNVYGIAPLQEANMPGKLTNILRVFEPINFVKGRKPNSEYGGVFDKYHDTLSDSPVTIATKLGKNWRDYNYHVIIQSAVCNFRCFYCYVDYSFLGGKMVEVAADEVIKQFLQEREKALVNGQQYNVLRISGGEPMLIPDLTLICLRKIKELKLDDTVCVKTETNLSPLAKVNGLALAAEWADFEELSKYKNFIIHPTVHGISAKNLHNNCSVDPVVFDMVCEGLQTLIDYQLDFYPSFGANTTIPSDVQPFFNCLKKIHKNLPLRFAVRPFKFTYDAVCERKGRNSLTIMTNQNEVISKWDSLLQETYGVKYAEIPRNKVSLY
ncbi:putative Fe-S oxidoreductase [Gammaproteobacteria bacterium]